MFHESAPDQSVRSSNYDLQLLCASWWLKIVLGFVILAICGVADLLDPRAILAVPLDRLLQSTGPSFTRTPAELRFDQRRIDRVTSIVAGTILDVLDQTARFPKRLQDRLDHLDVPPLIARANVVNRT